MSRCSNPAHRHRRISPTTYSDAELGEKQIGFGGVLVFCNGASISLLDDIHWLSGDQEPAVYLLSRLSALFHAPPGDDITKDRQFFVGDGDGFSHLTLHMSSRPSAFDLL